VAGLSPARIVPCPAHAIARDTHKGHPGLLCRSGRIQLRSVRSIVVQSPWGGLCTPFRANKLSFLPPDGGQPTGLTGASFARGLLVPNQRFCRFFRFFPLPSGICPVFPVFSGFCRLFPAISAYFQTVLNWTFGHFLRL